MTKIQHRILTLLILLAFGIATHAQDVASRDASRASGPAVTISVTDRGVRFAALGSLGKMRLEVFNADGTSLYNSDFGAASVRDWAPEDKFGQRLPDGTYLCVITVRDLSGKMTTKQGSIVLQAGQPLLKLSEGESVESIESDKSLARITDPPALTVISNDGSDGQIVNTRGALTFKFGDFFGAKEKEVMRITPEGNLGLGVKSPRAKLDVAGTIRVDGIEFPNGSVQSTGLTTRTDTQGNIVPMVAGTGTGGHMTKWTDGAGNLGDTAVTESNGSVVVGNDTFRGNVQIYGAFNADVFSGMGQDLINGPAFNYGYSGSTFGRSSGFFNVRPDVSATPPNPSLRFLTANVQRMIVDNIGRVGIGVAIPQSLLDVNGDINVAGNATVSGNIAAKYQDIAEWTSARTKLEAGTVVSLDRQKANSVMASTKAYDTRVAGVVSAQPGVSLGVSGPNKVLVATTGRVKVRVNANRHPIHIGDLLVTSNAAGVAMKSEAFRLHGRTMHRPGTIIGKALESLDKGEGTILVLLSLQ